MLNGVSDPPRSVWAYNHVLSACCPNSVELSQSLYSSVTIINYTELTRNYAPPFCWLGLATSMGEGGGRGGGGGAYN